MRTVVFSLLMVMCMLGVSCSQKPNHGIADEPAGMVCYIQQSEEPYLLEPYVQMLADTTGQLNLQQVLEPVVQQQFGAVGDNSDPLTTHRYYWGKLMLENKLPGAGRKAEWVLTFNDSWSDLEVYVPEANGRWRMEKNGALTANSRKDFLPTSSGNHIELVLPPNEKVTIYFRGISERTAIIPSFYLRLTHLAVYYDALVKSKAGNAIFYGFILMMLFYNLVFFLIGGGRSFIFYSAYLFMVVVYAAFSSGDMVDWLSLFPNHPQYERLLKLSLYMGMMFYLTFIRSFVQLNRLLPVWDTIFRYIVYLGFPLMIADLVVLWQTNFSFVVEDRLTVPYISLIILAGAALMYPLWKTRDKIGYFVVAGIAAISLGCLLTVVTRVWLPPYTIFYLKAGIIVEILIFSLGLAYRRRREKHAQQQADFLLRESQLVQEKNEMEARRLQELNDFKARFYTNITHEFRTPLTVIMGMTENIQQHEAEKTLIRRNSQNLLQLINQLLDLSKLESDSLLLHPMHGDIIPYLQYLTESFYSAATQKNIRLVFYPEEKSVPMDYDEGKIQQIIYNLLTNALKFSRPGGQVVFHAGKAALEGQPCLRLVVKDNGIGISEEHIGQIFNRFYQANPEDDSSELSSGIGLALVKELVSLMKGLISVSSEPGQGTSFTILLPIEAKAQLREYGAPKPNIGIGSLSSPFPQPVVSPALQEEDYQDTDLPDLLIIEDNADIISYIKSILQRQYRLHTAANGTEGIAMAQELMPDIIISDLMMPGKNGYEVCDALKLDERTSHIPIILLTAKATQADKVDGLKHGADAYLTKPFDKSELLVLLENLVKLRRQLQAHYATRASSSTPLLEPSVDDLFLQKLAQQIDEHLDEPEFGVVQLSASVHMSQMQVYRKLKALTGQTPSQFIRAHRLRQGRQLLRKGGLTIAEIAYAVGFNEPSYFSRVFQQEFGKSPSDYLK